MSDEAKKCPACNGRGYHRCDCWPGDCICGYGDETCEECMGDGWIEPWDWYDDEYVAPPPSHHSAGEA